MTTLASYINMLAFQFENSQIMVKSGRCPASASVATFAIAAEPDRMRIILFMAGNTVSG